MEPENKTYQKPIDLVESAAGETPIVSSSVKTDNAVDHGESDTDRKDEDRIIGCSRPLPGTTRTDIHNIVHLIRSSTCAEDWNNMYSNEKDKDSDCWRTCTRCEFDVLNLTDPSDETLKEAISMRVLKPGQRKNIWRRADGTFMVDNCAIKRSNPSLMGAICLAVIGVLPLAFLLTTAPGFVTPFLNHPVGRIVCFCYLTWNLFGAFLFSKTRGKVKAHRVLRVFIVILFTIPSMLLQLLSPACIVIFMALGPIFGGQ